MIHEQVKRSNRKGTNQGPHNHPPQYQQTHSQNNYNNQQQGENHHFGIVQTPCALSSPFFISFSSSLLTASIIISSKGCQH